MANSVTTQLLQDGPRNVIVKFEGVLDTSDLAATGTLGTAATGATTSGSPNITFTAGGLTPVQGQFVTGTGIPSGTYIVSFTTTTAVLSANATATNTGLTFTLTAGNIVVVDPSALSILDYFQNRYATKLAIKKITYNVEDNLSINLFWDATTPVRIEEIVGRGKMDHMKSQPLQNNAGTGVTGRILAASQGWAASGVLSFSMIIELIKQ